MKIEQAYELAQKNSIVGRDKLLFLYDAVKNSVGGDIVEIGCYRGGSSLMLALASQEYFPNKYKIYICDTFEGVALAGKNDNYHKDGDFNDTSINLVDDLLRSNGLDNFVIVKGIFPTQSHHLVDTDKISVLHIDVDVYEGYKLILEWAQNKLLPGAIIILDDYNADTCKGAKLAVDEYLQTRNDFYKQLHNDGPCCLIYTP